MKENNFIGNTNALKYKDEKELQKDIDKYFQDCDANGKPYTMTGLALALGIDRTTLINYGKRELFSTLVKTAKSRVEQQLEESLYRLGNNSGVIFNLKNNYGWKDTVEVGTKEEDGILKDLVEAMKDAKKD